MYVEAITYNQGMVYIDYMARLISSSEYCPAPEAATSLVSGLTSK